MLANRRLERSVTDGDRDLHHRVAKVGTRFMYFTADLPYRKRLQFNCHSICRALQKLIPEFKVVDGLVVGVKHTEKGIEPRSTYHSWLLTPDDSIIDPYPVGCISKFPLLVVNKGVGAFSGGNLYVPNIKVTSKIANRKLFRKSAVLYRLLKRAQYSCKDIWPD